MKPSIGRIVIWTSNADQIFPAIITQVWSDTTVNLGVFAHNYFEQTSVLFGEGRNQWHWPVRVE